MAFKHGALCALLLLGLCIQLPISDAQPVATPRPLRTTIPTAAPPPMETTQPQQGTTVLAQSATASTPPSIPTEPPQSPSTEPPPSTTAALPPSTTTASPPSTTTAPTPSIPTAPSTTPPTAPPPSTTTQEPTTTPPPCPSRCTCNSRARTVDCVMASLSSIPSDIPQYTTTLTLNENNFNLLPRGAFAHLPNLIALHLISCGIQSIANGAFNGLNHLRVLSLKANQLTSVQGVFQGMPELQELDLEQNRLASLSQSMLRDFPNLRVLSIGNNELLSEVSSGAFDMNPMLQRLSISHCALRQIPQDVFQSLTMLQRLDLSGNQVFQIPPGVFEGLTSLQDLMLSSMSLVVINETVFTGLSQLQTLNLGYNNLMNLDIAPLMPLSSLTTLVLTGNPWDCNCRMSQFLTWLKLTQIDHYSTQWTCVTPDVLQGQLVYTIQQDNFACVPIINKRPSSMVIDYQGYVYFECDARGDPEPEILWYRPDGMQVTATTNAENVYTAFSSTVLVIQKAEAINGGNYNCTARNSHGARSVQFSLIVNGIPTTAVPTTPGNPSTVTTDTPPCKHAPIRVLVDNIKDTSVRMRWTTYNSPFVKGYIIQTTEFGMEQSSIKLANEEDTFLTVSDLKPGGEYIICVTVFLETCPSITTVDQCEFLTTAGSIDDGMAALVTKHNNEIIGSVLATFFGTLLILASIFVILWQYRKPKSYTKYDFKSTSDSAHFADLEGGSGESSKAEMSNQIRYTGSLNKGAAFRDDEFDRMQKAKDIHAAEVYSIPPDAHPVYGTPQGKGKGKGKGGKGKRNSQAPLIEIELDKRNSDYMVPTPTKEEETAICEAKLVSSVPSVPEESDVGEFGHLYEELDSPKCECDPVVNGIIESNGSPHTHNHSMQNGHARNGSANKVRFSLPDDEQDTHVANGDISKPDTMVA